MNNERCLMSYENIFDRMITNEEKSVEKVLLNKEAKQIYKKIKHSKKYNKDLPLKTYNYLNHEIGFQGGFSKLKTFLKFISGKDNAYNIALSNFEYIVDSKGKILLDFDGNNEKPGEPTYYIFEVNMFVKPHKRNDKEAHQEVMKTVNKREDVAKEQIHKCYPPAKIETSVDPTVFKDNDGNELIAERFSLLVKVPLSFFFNDKSSETFNKKIEQNDINSTNKNYEYNLFSIEEGEEGGFEEAAGGGDEGGENQNPDGGAVEEPPMDDMMKNEPDENGEGGGMDDGSGGGDEGGFGDDSGDNNGENGNNDKKNVFDSNIGSSMNPFTQINQKLYQLETLNELRLSIKKTIDLYSAQYADWSEVCQLKELLKILDEERKSFMMQQNPENLLKLGLYHDQYDKLVQNISKRINKLVVNDRQ